MPAYASLEEIVVRVHEAIMGNLERTTMRLHDPFANQLGSMSSYGIPLTCQLHASFLMPDDDTLPPWEDFVCDYIMPTCIVLATQIERLAFNSDALVFGDLEITESSNIPGEKPIVYVDRELSVRLSSHYDTDRHGQMISIDMLLGRQVAKDLMPHNLPGCV